MPGKRRSAAKIEADKIRAAEMSARGMTGKEIGRVLRVSERQARQLASQGVRARKPSTSAVPPATVPEPREMVGTVSQQEAPVPPPVVTRPAREASDPKVGGSEPPTVVERELPKLLPIELCQPTESELRRRKQQDLHDKNRADNIAAADELIHRSPNDWGKPCPLKPDTPAARENVTANRCYDDGQWRPGAHPLEGDRRNI